MRKQALKKKVRLFILYTVEFLKFVPEVSYFKTNLTHRFTRIKKERRTKRIFLQSFYNSFPKTKNPESTFAPDFKGPKF